ncbi:MAG: BufA2 family periplasmic bufferin-type metallophore [Candidatus Binataceae bacterium]
MKKSALRGAMLATAVALMFTGSAIAADSAGSSTAAPAQVKCVGGNSCKGQSACKSASNGCQGQNSCKGKGYVLTSNAQQCAKQGGHAGKAD